ERAGGKCAEIFTREAVAEIHARSRGIPRTISVICDNALIAGFAADRRPIDRAIVSEICRDLDFARADFVLPPRPNGNGRSHTGTDARGGPPTAAAAGPPPAVTAGSPAPATQPRPGNDPETPGAGSSGMFSSFARRRRSSFF